MSKLTKLLFHPGAFFRDWKANREFDRQMAGEQVPPELARELRDGAGGAPTELDLRKLFETFIVPHFRLVRMPDSPEGIVNVGILAEERIRLLKALFVLVAKLPIDIRIKKGGSMQSLSSLSFREGHNLLFDDDTWVLDFEQDSAFYRAAKRGQQGDAKSAVSAQIDGFLEDVLKARDTETDLREFFVTDEQQLQRFRISIFERQGRFYQAEDENIVARKFPVKAAEKAGLFERGRGGRLEAIHPCPVDSFCAFPIDFVYTWVNNLDPEWQRLYREHAPQASDASIDTMSMDRFFNRDELKYSLRSVDRFAPWVRKVFIVTNCAPPPWLDLENEKICFVDHKEIFDEADLPTFNSHAIEAKLHHIPGLETHFVYFNDDMFLGRNTVPEDFFLGNGVSASILENYGMVNGDLNKHDPDYLNAARNGKRLIEERFGLSPTQLHTHSPYCLNRDVLFEMEREFKVLFKETASSRFRAITNISIPSFFYHHYAYHKGKAYRKRDKTILLKVDSPNFAQKVNEIKKLSCLSFCLNDGNSSADDKRWHRTVLSLLRSVFPRKSSFEK